MLNIRSGTSIVEVDGVKYEWQLQREPQWSDADGWKGMMVSLVQKDTQRAAILEFGMAGFVKGSWRVSRPRGRL